MQFVNDVNRPLRWLGDLTAAQFMRRHWQRRPLLVRQAFPVADWLSRRQLFKLASLDALSARLIQRDGRCWQVSHGPFKPRDLPATSLPRWTLLVQGVDTCMPAARALLDHFRFVPEARLDDLMVSWASDGGGVGPHLDSYDVFLLQLHGRRRWRIGPTHDERLRAGLPLKILRHFVPTEDWVLEPGDMLYLPPRWGHDGVAVGECMTASVGFRAPSSRELARELLLRVADAHEELPDRLYRDAGAVASIQPGAVPPAMQAFADRSVRRLLASPNQLARALGEYLTEPKPQLWFTASAATSLSNGVTLAPGSRMMYDMHHVFMNGESLRASGRDALLMRQLADQRSLDADSCRRGSAAARKLLAEWLAQGWLLPRGEQ